MIAAVFSQDEAASLLSHSQPVRLMVARRKKNTKSKRSLLGTHQRSDIWGRHAVLEVLAAGFWEPVEVLVREDLPSDLRDTIDRLCEPFGLTPQPTTGPALTKRTGARDHQGVVAKMTAFPYADAEDVTSEITGLVLCLDGVQDPFNLGGILRSAEVFGVEAVLLGKAHQTGITSQVVRGSAGAVAHLPVARSDSLPEVLRDMQSHGCRVYVASEKAAVSCADAELTFPACLVIGNEGRGPSDEVMEVADEHVVIPQRGRVGSLNAAVSAGILLYEFDRRR